MTPDAIATVKLIVLTSLGLAIVGVAAYFLLRFLRDLDSGDPPSADRHWGGLGGSLSGWRMSNSLVHLVAALVLATLGAICVLAAAPPPEPAKIKTDIEKNQADAAINAADAKKNLTKAAENEATAAKLAEAEKKIASDAKKNREDAAAHEAAADKNRKDAAMNRDDATANDAAAEQNRKTAATNDAAAKKNREDAAKNEADAKSLQAALEALKKVNIGQRSSRVLIVPSGTSACILIEPPATPARAKSTSTTRHCPPPQQSTRLVR